MRLVFPNEIFLGEWIHNKIHTENSAPRKWRSLAQSTKICWECHLHIPFFGGVSLVSAVLPTVSKL